MGASVPSELASPPHPLWPFGWGSVRKGCSLQGPPCRVPASAPCLWEAVWAPSLEGCPALPGPAWCALLPHQNWRALFHPLEVSTDRKGLGQMDLGRYFSPSLGPPANRDKPAFLKSSDYCRVCKAHGMLVGPRDLDTLPHWGDPGPR